MGRDVSTLEDQRREFEEEIGSPVEGPFIPLSPVRQAGGKVVSLWAAEGDLDVARCAATSSPWNGRRDQAISPGFLKSIARSGSMPGQR